MARPLLSQAVAMTGHVDNIPVECELPKQPRAGMNYQGLDYKHVHANHSI